MKRRSRPFCSSKALSGENLAGRRRCGNQKPRNGKLIGPAISFSTRPIKAEKNENMRSLFMESDVDKRHVQTYLMQIPLHLNVQMRTATEFAAAGSPDRDRPKDRGPVQGAGRTLRGLGLAAPSPSRITGCGAETASVSSALRRTQSRIAATTTGPSGNPKVPAIVRETSGAP